MRAAFIRGLIKSAQNDPKIMLITGDLGYRFLEPFADIYPERFINIGVAEANMVTVAAGLASVGWKPFIYSIATFASMRAFEQIRTDIVMQKMNVKIVGIGAGLAYTKAGPTHHSMEDIALMRLLPGMVVVAPVDTNECEIATQKLCSYDGYAYLRLERNPDSPLHLKLPDFMIGKAYPIVIGKDVAILATGAKASTALKVVELLKKNNITPSLYAFPTIQPLDTTILNTILKTYRTIYTIEEHRVSGGFGSAIVEYANSIQIKNTIRIEKIGLTDTFTTVSAEYDTLLAYHGLTPSLIADRIYKLCR